VCRCLRRILLSCLQNSPGNSLGAVESISKKL
jgi:hypothetical protein